MITECASFQLQNVFVKRIRNYSNVITVIRVGIAGTNRGESERTRKMFTSTNEYCIYNSFHSICHNVVDEGRNDCIAEMSLQVTIRLNHPMLPAKNVNK